MMKGQTQAVTAVLITGIVMGGVGSAYFWGVPMLEKREIEQEITSTEDDVLNLRDQIVSVSREGEGASTTVTVDADSISLEPNDEYIQVNNELDQSAEQGFTWSLLEGSSTQNISVGAGDYGIQGEELPGVVAYQSIAGEGSSEINYRVEFRNLCSTNTGELSKIDLVPSGQDRASGEVQIQVSNQGEQVDNNVVMSEGACEGRTSRTNTQLQISFQ